MEIGNFDWQIPIVPGEQKSAAARYRKFYFLFGGGLKVCNESFATLCCAAAANLISSRSQLYDCAPSSKFSNTNSKVISFHLQ